MNCPDTLCQKDFGQANIQTEPFLRTCRYHRQQGQGFCGTALYPAGFCPHAFNASYPYALALLYDARYPDAEGNLKQSFETRCPATANTVFFRIDIRYTMPKWLRILKRLLIRFLQKLGIPAEYPDKAVFYQVQEVTGQCPRGLKKGNVFFFNLHNRKELCPASFHSLYPILMKNSARAEAPSVLHCPDPDGVSYCVPQTSWQCEDFFSIGFEMSRNIHSPQSSAATPERFSSEDLLPQGFCPLAFYTIFPYYQTLLNGGEFEWVTPGKNVRVQCPRSDGIVMNAMKIHRDAPGNGTVRISIENVLGHCPRGHTKDQSFDLSSGEQAAKRSALALMVGLARQTGDSPTYYGVSDLQQDGECRVILHGPTGK